VRKELEKKKKEADDLEKSLSSVRRQAESQAKEYMRLHEEKNKLVQKLEDFSIVMSSNLSTNATADANKPKKE
jgi:hypothetical protein